MCLNSFFAIGGVLIVRSALSEKIFPECLTAVAVQKLQGMSGESIR